MIAWTTPVGIANDKRKSLFERMKDYRDNHTTQYEGVRLNPNLETLKMIIEAQDLLPGMRLIVESDSLS
jgi:ABC-type Fe3+-citrate transport system substrate-binding protein